MANPSKPAGAGKRSPRPAVSIEEIASRLKTLARNLERKAIVGAQMEPDEMRAVAKRLRSYAERLGSSPPTFTIY